MLALVPTVHKSELLVIKEGAIALGGGEVTLVLLLILLSTVLSLVLSVIIVSEYPIIGINNNNQNNILTKEHQCLQLDFSAFLFLKPFVYPSNVVSRVSIFANRCSLYAATKDNNSGYLMPILVLLVAPSVPSATLSPSESTSHVLEINNE